MKADLSQWHAAAREAIAALEAAKERLEMNDVAGEEAPFIDDCAIALAMLSSLPINREAADAHQWPEEIQRMIDEA